MRRTGGVLLLIAVAGLGVLVLTRSNGHAPIPSVFSENLTLADAEARVSGSDRPVLVFATADWCGPCQHFKRTTLVDPTVSRWIVDHTVPVYLDIDRSTDQAARFSITSIPASIMVRDGRVVSRLQGAVGTEEYMAWLTTSAGPDKK